LRDKQESSPAGKLATLGELTTGVAHELNNPLNNIASTSATWIDRIMARSGRSRAACQRPGEGDGAGPKGDGVISHLRNFGGARVSIEQSTSTT